MAITFNVCLSCLYGLTCKGKTYSWTPGKAPHSAIPSRNRNVINWVAEVIKAERAATAPQSASMHPSHGGAPTFTNMRLLGI